MAKAGRRHAADRLLGAGSGGAAAANGTDLPDLAEDEVFWSARSGSGDGGSWVRRNDHPDRGRPWACSAGDGGLSLALEPRRASAPMEVPVWPSFLREDSTASPVEWLGRRAGEDEDDEEGGWVPPHEYLAKEEKGRRAATSVLEGAGRTLKGRDMSRVRDAVWSRTGFFG